MYCKGSSSATLKEFGNSFLPSLSVPLHEELNELWLRGGTGDKTRLQNSFA